MVKKIGTWNHYDKLGLGEPYTYIHPYKQGAVKHLVDNKPDWVTHIIVFGSSLTTAHFKFNDLDVCLIGLEDEDDFISKGLKLKDVKYDFIIKPSLQALIEDSSTIGCVEKSILKDGLLVYEQED